MLVAVDEDQSTLTCWSYIASQWLKPTLRKNEDLWVKKSFESVDDVLGLKEGDAKLIDGLEHRLIRPASSLPANTRLELCIYDFKIVLYISTG